MVTVDNFKMPEVAKMSNYSDNCHVNSVSQNVTVNSTLAVGNHTISVTVKDQSGNEYENSWKILTKL
jgi:hypothetical protein